MLFFIRLVEKVINKILLVMVCSMMFAMLVAISIQVTCRYLLNFSPTWTEEVARYLMIWLCFFGAPLAVGIGGHVGIQYFMLKVPSELRKAVRIITMISIIVLLLIIVKKGYDLNLLIWVQVSPALRISMGYVYLAVPVGCILMVIEFVYAILKGTKDGDHLPFIPGGEI